MKLVGNEKNKIEKKNLNKKKVVKAKKFLEKNLNKKSK
jgi:hypothetical protein